LLLAVGELGMSGYFYMARVIQAVELGDIASGVGKTFFFGYFIGVIACNNGMRVRGGADGVGHATTQTVVTASIVVLISDFFLTKLFHLIAS
jgi:phospholipid/cholesterol/gamma-HCH transport system permease protein